MSQSSQNNQDQFIDIHTITKKIRSIRDGISTSIFTSMVFIKRNIIIFFVLVIIGVIAGYFLDKGLKNYKNEIIVSPNFKSSDYLYSKIDLLESKIKAGDTVFFKSIGIENSKKLNDIKIDPVVDIYDFINEKGNTTNNAQNTQNFEFVKLLSESGDINKVIKEKITSKNYTRHVITISTKGLASSEKTITPILNYLNNNEYYDSVQKIFISNLITKMNENQLAINQINNLLNQFASTTSNNNLKSDKLVYYNENTQLNEILNNKYNLISEIAYQRIQLIDYNKTIKEFSRVLNIKEAQNIFTKMKFIIPLILIFGFVFFSFFKSFYKRQMQKLQ